jgi:hypothetical protein
MTRISERRQYGILTNRDIGPSFGGDDIYIANNSNKTMDSLSNLGHTYKHPRYAKGTNEAMTFLAGSNKFQLDEIDDIIRGSGNCQHLGFSEARAKPEAYFTVPEVLGAPRQTLNCQMRF